MAATVTVEEMNGAGPAYTVISQGAPGRFQTIDQKAQGDYPIQIPSSGHNYSYWKHFCLNLQGTFTKINNIRLFCDGTLFAGLGTNGGVQIGKRDTGDHGCPTANYHQAGVDALEVQGETGVHIHETTNGHPYYYGETAEPEDFANYSASGDSILIDSTDHSGTGYSKSAVLQVVVDSAGSPAQGEKTDETFTFRYDEV